MWQFDYPWLLFLLPLPGLAYRYLPAYVETRTALRVPFFSGMRQAIGQAPGVLGGRWQLLLNLLVWGLLLAACARPVWVEKPIEREQPMRDLLLAIDISQSMQTQDYTDLQGQQVDRLSAVKAVVRDFLSRRKDDRIGLIVFGSAAYPQAPLSMDHASLGILLDEVAVGMAGPNTALGDAIGLAVKLLDKTREQEKIVLLLTDGNDNASAIPPERAAEIAREHGVRVHTIGIGNPEAEDEARVDLQALQNIARLTGGRFFQATDRAALQEVYNTLDQITPHQVKQLSHQPKRDLFWLPLGAALLLLLAAHSMAVLVPLFAALRRTED